MGPIQPKGLFQRCSGPRWIMRGILARSAGRFNGFPRAERREPRACQPTNRNLIMPVRDWIRSVFMYHLSLVLSTMLAGAAPEPGAREVSAAIARGVAFLEKEASGWKEEHH